MRKKNIAKEKLVFLCIAIAILLPTMFTILHTYMMLDDFNYGVLYRDNINQGYNIITASIKHAYNYYMDFSGFYTAAFLDMLFAGVISSNPWRLRILCVIVAVLFYVTLYIFLKVSLKYIVKMNEKKVLYSIYILLLLCFTNIEEYSENFYWYLCVISYLLLAVFILAGLSCFIYAVYKNSRKWLIAACIIGFLGCGGSLNVAAFCCVFYFLTGLWAFFIKHNKKNAIIGFASVMAGAIFNVLSPGNYSRYGQPLTFHNLLVAVYQSGDYLIDRIYWMLTDSMLLFIVAIMIVLVFMIKSKETQFKYPVPVLFSCASVLAILAIIFPVMLGYQGCYTGDRWIFYSDMGIYFFFIINLFYWRGYINRKYSEIKLEKKQLPVVGVIVFLCFCIFLG